MVPHATNKFERRRSSSPQPTPTTYKFPDFGQDQDGMEYEDTFEDISRGPSPKPLLNGLPPGLHSSERWPARRESKPSSWKSWANGVGRTRHGRQKSLSEAIRTVRTRNASISENAQEIADSLKAPISYKLVVCIRDKDLNHDLNVLILVRYCALSGSPHLFLRTRPRRRS